MVTDWGELYELGEISKNSHELRKPRKRTTKSLYVESGKMVPCALHFQSIRENIIISKIEFTSSK